MTSPPENIRLKDLKERILARSTKRKQGNIQALWTLMEKMHSQGVRVFSVSIVGRASERSGGVKLQSMLNKGGADYRELIAAFAEEVGSSGPTQRKGPSPLELAIDSIPDLDVRTKLRMILSKAKRLEADNDRLREALRQSQTPQVAEESREFKPEKTSSYPIRLGEEPRVDTEALFLLRRSISADWVDERRWVVDDHGTIYDEYGERITPVAFVRRVEALISAFEDLRTAGARDRSAPSVPAG